MTELTVNGTRHQIDGAQSRTLLDVLRDDLDLQGAKLGCGEGECGACTVLVDGRAVCACLQLAGTVANRQVMTVEAFSQTREGARLAGALASAGAVQCGFCTPGIMMALAGHFRAGNDDDVEAALEGNLCRCTGYARIRAALGGLTCLPSSAPARHRRDMSIRDALQALAREPALTPIAGGTDLLVRHEYDLAGRRFLDLTRIDDEEMTTIGKMEDSLSIGASVTWSEIVADPAIATRAPVLVQAARTIGGVQIRNMGTIGGNLATASPAGDGLPALAVLDAEIVMASASGRRRLPLADFLRGPGKTALAPGELIVAIRVPPAGQEQVHIFRKAGPRRAQAIAKVSMALICDQPAGRPRRFTIAFGAVGPVPMRCTQTAKVLASGPPTRALLERATRTLQGEISPIDDFRSTKSYRGSAAARLLADAVTSLDGRTS